MSSKMTRREFVVAGTGVACAAALAAAPAHAQTAPLTIGYRARRTGEVIEGRTFQDVAIGIHVRANNVTIRRCLFRRLMSNGSNGTAIVVDKGIVGTRIVECEVDGSASISHGAGIALHPGSRAAEVCDCYIHHMQRVGISIGSTTYAEFATALPEQSEHLIARNVIEYCGTLGATGDAGSGIVIVGMSHRHVLRENRIRRNHGHGIVLSGSRQGDGSSGTPKFDEAPTWNTLAQNIVEYNGEDGIRNCGANYTWIRHNFCYANGGAQIRIASLGGLADARGIELMANRQIG